MTNAFELPLLQQWGATATQGTGEADLGGSPMRTTLQPPCRSPALLSARAFAFTQLSALSINKPRGLSLPSTSTPAASGKSPVPGSCRGLPMFPLSPQNAMVGAFPLIVFHSCHLHALPGGPSLPCRAGSGAGRDTRLPGLLWGTFWHPASVSQSAKPWAALWQEGPKWGRSEFAVTWVDPGSAPGTPQS